MRWHILYYSKITEIRAGVVKQMKIVKMDENVFTFSWKAKQSKRKNFEIRANGQTSKRLIFFGQTGKRVHDFPYLSMKTFSLDNSLRFFLFTSKSSNVNGFLTKKQTFSQAFINFRKIIHLNFYFLGCFWLSWGPSLRCADLFARWISCSRDMTA